MKRIYIVLALTGSLMACGGGDDTVTPPTPTPLPTPTPSPTPTPEDKDLDTYDAPNRNAIAAFPGAEGAAKFTTGGAGGSVYTVTNLADDGSEGTLRWALNKQGKRTIVFGVGGTIELTKELNITNGDVTIAGQTAPGMGICLKNYNLRISASNVIVRFLHCRMGDEAKAENDAMNSYYNKTGYSGWRNIMIDHCSMSWSIDECGSFYGSENLTLQWCILSESLTNSFHTKEAHGYGGIWGGAPATFHHNLLAHHSNRTPRLNGSRYSNEADKEKVDVINNVIYNWGGEGAYAGQGGNYNIENNYYKPGPYNVAKSVHCRFFTPYPDDGKNAQAEGVCGKFWLSGNYMDSRDDLSNSQKKEVSNANADNFSVTAFVPKTNVKGKSGNTVNCTQDNFKATSHFDNDPNGYGYREDAKTAYEYVLAYAGASYKRDKIDKRIADEVKNGTYSSTSSNGGSCGLIDTQTDTNPTPWAEYATTTSTFIDSDGDGIPDDWEKSKGMKPNDATDGAKYQLSKEYTNLEVYLNELVQSTFPTK